MQLRDKTASAAQLLQQARALLQVTRPAGIPLLINDRVDVAVAVEADGVHLGQDDVPIDVARRILGAGRIVGKSTHSLEQAVAAEQEGVDYIAVGPIFSTPTKPDYGSVGATLIGAVQARVKQPIVCIGGIDQQTVSEVRRAGARCVAVVRAVCAAEDPKAATRTLKDLMQQPHRASASAHL